MKLQEATPSVFHRSGTSNATRKAFGMAVSKKTFKIMSSTIYKYKIRAIIREISCNAIDGHVAAGNTGNFDVQLPTELDPRFIVRDYGTGLTPDQIETVFQTYFESTKTDSNDFIGALGLGSKSPFCYYTETFTVESVVDGIKSGYSAYMDNGEPFIENLYSCETEEPNGVSVIVPVKVSDIPEWINEAKRVYEPFHGIRPNFVGVKLDINYQPAPPTDGKIMIVHNSNYWKGLYARMGNIVYPIDQELFEGTLVNCYVKSDKTNIIDFPIGSLDFQPSREELSMDHKTRQTILDKITQLKGRFHDMLIKEYSEKKTTREKIAYFSKLPDSLQQYFCRTNEFFINGQSPMDIRDTMIDKDWIIKNSNRFHGFWANSWSASRCDYHAIGRGSEYKHRNETQRRADLKKLLDPSVQKKLYIIDMDIKNRFSAPLIGYVTLDDDIKGYIHLVSAPHSEMGIELLNDLITRGFYEESEIVRLKASEMTKEIEKYDSMRPKTEREPSEDPDRVRPKSANVIRWTRDEDGCMIQEPLYLSKADFLALEEEYAIRIYGIDTGYPLKRPDDSNYMDLDVAGPASTTVPSKYLDALGIKSFLMLRNSVWNWIGDSKLICLDDALYAVLVNSLKRLKPNTISCVGGTEYHSEIRRLDDKFDVQLTPLVKNRYNAVDCRIVDLLFSYIQRNGDRVPRDPKLAPLAARYIQMKEDMETRADEAYKTFMKLNPLLAAVMECVTDNYQAQRTLTRDTKEDFKKLIRWK